MLSHSWEHVRRSEADDDSSLCHLLSTLTRTPVIYADLYAVGDGMLSEHVRA